MKIRIKFAKRGNMKFVGHLDIMRYFQKAMLRAGVDIIYSEGFSPHQIMSFAAPLGVGLTSEGEYFDIEVQNTGSSFEMIERLNRVMVEGMEVLNYVLLPDTAQNAMSLVTAADYLISYRGEIPSIREPLETFLAREQINVVKTTKKSEKEVDIKPMIHEALQKDGILFLKTAAGSVANLKPELFMEAFHRANGIKWKPSDIQICRLEIYGMDEKDMNLKPLDHFGREIC